MKHGSNGARRILGLALIWVMVKWQAVEMWKEKQVNSD